MADDVDAAGAEVTDLAEANAPEVVAEPEDGAVPKRNRLSRRLFGTSVRQAVVCGLVVVTVLAGLVGWLGYRMDQSRRSDQERAVLLQAGKQAALDLTTIDYNRADADVARVLNSTTGKFHDDFQKRSQPFLEMVKKTQSSSVGTIAEAGLESVENDAAQVLVAVQVKTTSAVDPNTHPVKGWRMRIDVQRVGRDVKVTNVEFIQ